MQKIFLFFFLFNSVVVFSQKKYFQQQVDYTIDVRLNDKSHILHAYEKINYTNHSPDTLRFIFFHLWPNAYKNDQTAFNEQMVENNQTAFYFSKEEKRGFVDSLHFKVNNEDVNVSEYNNHADVILIELLNPLLPNETIEISTPFRVVIPEVFSRLGHKEQSYQISQWHPKPAVYDHKGWHPMPYLDQGEFYSEFGNYNVQITLPANYVVAATGDLQNESEIAFIQSRMLKNDSSLLNTLAKNPVSSENFKTIRYTQQNVHDFAWFANKQFLVELSIDTLPNLKQTNCFSYYTPKEHKYYDSSSRIIAQTIHYFSTHVGEYPYKHASIVAGYLLAGGGMEYPNVTVIGEIESKKTLQTVIIHEVGHNWFYGLLGSNEREHPWMDEGINSFYEKELDNKLKEQKTNHKDQQNLQLDGVQFLYPLAAKQHEDQAISTSSVLLTKLNYGGIVYGKTASMFAYLQSYLGEVLFEQCMKSYYQLWHFKHPYPEDIRAVFEKESGKNLAWFFDEGLQTVIPIDFKIKKASIKQQKGTVQIKSKTSFTGPVPISFYDGDSILSTQWAEYPYEQPIVYTAQSNTISKIVLNAHNHLPEISLNNNFYEKKGLFHKANYKLKIGSSLGLKTSKDLYFLPAAGYNFYDKAMLGLVLHNIKIPNNQFQFAFTPLYSFGSRSLVGTGILGYSLFTKNHHKVTLAIQGNTFHHLSSSLNISDPLFARHIKIAPSVSIDFRQKELRNTQSDQWIIKYYHIMNQGFTYSMDITDSLFRPSISNYVTQSFLNTRFTHKNNRTFNPFSYEINAIGNDQFLKLGLTTNLRIDYHLKNKSFYFRAYIGKFFDFKNTSSAFDLRPQYLNATHTDLNDYVYNETYLARNQQKGALSQQISMQEGGMKIKTNLYANPIGENNNWLAAINLRSDIPIQLPIRLPLKFQLFMDAATYAKADKLNPSGSKLIYDAGVQVNLIGDLFVLYLPLLMSKDFKDYGKSVYGKKRFENTISFSLNLSKLDLLNTQRVIHLVGL
ncbi:MAG: M1 family metallopeptidase [Bacteroidetes bacterium]|jgi:hypothetical protein|nr:M1 family metallopeptidase [Bacteroidota bacterium]